MNQLNIFTHSLFFTDQKDTEFKEQVKKTSTVNKDSFEKIVKNFIVGLTKNYNIDKNELFINNIKYVEDLKEETNLNIVKPNVLFQIIYMLDVDEDCGLFCFERQTEVLIAHTDFLRKFNFIARENTVLSIPFNVDFKLTKNESDKKRSYIYFTLDKK